MSLRDENKKLPDVLAKNILATPYWQMYGELNLEGFVDEIQSSTVRYAMAVILLAIYMLGTNQHLRPDAVELLQVLVPHSHDFIKEYYYRPCLPPPLIFLPHLFHFAQLCYKAIVRCRRKDDTEGVSSDDFGRRSASTDTAASAAAESKDGPFNASRLDQLSQGGGPDCSQAVASSVPAMEAVEATPAEAVDDEAVETLAAELTAAAAPAAAASEAVAPAESEQQISSRRLRLDDIVQSGQLGPPPQPVTLDGVRRNWPLRRGVLHCGQAPLPRENRMSTQFSHSAWPHAFTIIFRLGLVYLVALHSGHFCLSMGANCDAVGNNNRLFLDMLLMTTALSRRPSRRASSSELGMNGQHASQAKQPSHAKRRPSSVGHPVHEAPDVHSNQLLSVRVHQRIPAAQLLQSWVVGSLQPSCTMETVSCGAGFFGYISATR
uniref:Acyl_transf_3 domain-containing protein n=1 Tax=Macrostomum lignano TaxID=282301 RepID=A0A1I8FL30_9PLAT